MRKTDNIVLWPVYFDSTKTKSEGRKVPKRLGHTMLTLGMIEKAVQSLKAPYRSVPEASHPYSPWRRTGMILVKRTKPKSQILKDVAKELGKNPT